MSGFRVDNKRYLEFCDRKYGPKCATDKDKENKEPKEVKEVGNQ